VRQRHNQTDTDARCGPGIRATPAMPRVQPYPRSPRPSFTSEAGSSRWAYCLLRAILGDVAR
jgi:hypothetical protein